jgi:hypothetical protein
MIAKESDGLGFWIYGRPVPALPGCALSSKAAPIAGTILRLDTQLGIRTTASYQLLPSSIVTRCLELVRNRGYLPRAKSS